MTIESPTYTMLSSQTGFRIPTQGEDVIQGGTAQPVGFPQFTRP